MCQSKAEGGRRCASSDYTVAKARKTIPAPTSLITGDEEERSSYQHKSEEYLNNLTPDEKQAITAYVNQEYENINSQLWSGDSDHHLVPLLDKALSQGSSEVVTAYRKPAFPFHLTKAEEKELAGQYTKVGAVIESKGYMSTSANPNAMIPLLAEPITPSRWADADFIEENDMTHKNIVFEIVSDKGRPVSTVSHMPQEEEYLLPRDTRWKVVRVTPNVKFSTSRNLATGEPQHEKNREATVVQLIEV